MTKSCAGPLLMLGQASVFAAFLVPQDLAYGARLSWRLLRQMNRGLVG